ncbi:MAG: hypothetical protein EXS55_03620 [Candidatus Magasanikbacteria bacterium]|nr:hypothetical protein [Candidatus Magasanikbacteria bacterium]
MLSRITLAAILAATLAGGTGCSGDCAIAPMGNTTAVTLFAATSAISQDDAVGSGSAPIFTVFNGGGEVVLAGFMDGQGYATPMGGKAGMVGWIRRIDLRGRDTTILIAPPQNPINGARIGIALGWHVEGNSPNVSFNDAAAPRDVSNFKDFRAIPANSKSGLLVISF